MKKTIAIILLAFYTLELCACAKVAVSDTSVSFYYPRNEYTYGEEGSVIDAEIRQRSDDLSKTISLYLLGPEDSVFRSIFPADVVLIHCTTEDDLGKITLSDQIADLSSLDLTLACTSLAMTCMELTNVDTVSIRAETLLLNGKQSLDFSRSSICMVDMGSEEASKNQPIGG